MSESIYLIREQGSGEPRASRSALIERIQVPLGRAACVDRWEKVSNDRVVCHLDLNES